MKTWAITRIVESWASGGRRADFEWAKWRLPSRKYVHRGHAIRAATRAVESYLQGAGAPEWPPVRICWFTVDIAYGSTLGAPVKLTAFWNATTKAWERYQRDPKPTSNYTEKGRL